MIKELGKNKYMLIASVNVDGKRIRKHKTVNCGKREANRLYAEWLKEVKADALAESPYLYDAMNSFVEHCKVTGKSANTIKGYNGIIRRIISLLPNKRMDKVKSIDINKMIAEMSNFSPKTIKNTVAFLSRVYERSIKLGEVESNPCKYAEIPKQKQSQIQTIPQAEMQSYISGLNDLDLDTKVALELALFCGMRRSEILGLRESDVSFEHNSITVRNTRHRVENTNIEQGTKTARSRRTLAMPKFVADDVNYLIEMHKSLEFKTSDYLIQDGFGEPLNPSTLSNRSIRYCKSHNLEVVSMHRLRHTYASMLINSRQADIIQISAELGHSNTTTTLNIYGHLTEEASESSKHISSIVEALAQKLPN